MKNIHILPTDKPSRLVLDDTTQQLILINKGEALWGNRNIYITSDEEIKVGDWFLPQGHINPHKLKEYNKINGDLESYNGLCYDISKCKKIILTTDQDLIKDGVQAIDDEFLEWFVKNPSCEGVGIQKQYQYHSSKEFYIDADYVDCTKEQYESIKKEIPTCPLRILYKIIIPKEEPKQETLEEANWKVLGTKKDTFYNGAKWQQERSYSEEDMIEFGFSTYCYISELMGVPFNLMSENRLNAEEWFEQFKKK